ARAAAQKNPLQRAPLAGLEQTRETTVAGEERRNRHAAPRPRRVSLPADRPRGARLHGDEIAIDFRPRIGGNVKARLRPGVVADPEDAVEKARLLDEQHAL